MRLPERWICTALLLLSHVKRDHTVTAVESDRLFFRRAHHESYRETIESMFTWDEAEQDRYADGDFDTRHPQIIWCDGAQCGVIGAQDKGDHIWLGPLFVLPTYQGSGIGTQVVKQFIQHAIKEKRPLKLQTLKKNLRAKALYERLGFRVTGSTDIYWNQEYVPV